MDSTKRKRSRLACQPCRERKRKCDGNEPCTTCTDWGYNCFYEARNVRRRPSRGAETVASATSSHGPAAVPRPVKTGLVSLAGTSVEPEPDNRGVVRRLEANSGAAFVRKLGLKINPSKAPKLNLFGWNVGARKLSSLVADDISTPLPITEITSLSHMRSLAQTYFEQVDPCYGFIDRAQYFHSLENRWAAPVAPSLYDSVLAGVAALGCVFSQRKATIAEMHFVRSARSTLDNAHLSGPPSIELLTGWTLRTVYLRITDTPYATWMASCTLMHLVEASGLHPQSKSPSLLIPSTQQCDSDLIRRLAGVAHHLNAWTSFDLGLCRVSFDLPALPSPRAGDYTAELLSLLPVSLSLDPNSSKEETDLTETLSNILSRSHTIPPSVMAQCNLVLCILRRIHTHNLDVPSILEERVLSLLRKGLDCARSMATNCHPWHQVANVPFNMTCVLLTMDTRGSLALLPEAMQTLCLVASTYDTETMREAYSTACLLVLLHQQRRRDDIHVLGEALKGGDYQQESTVSPLPDVSPSAEDYSWLGALVADMPGLQRVDFDQFLSADIIDDLSFLGR